MKEVAEQPISLADHRERKRQTAPKREAAAFALTLHQTTSKVQVAADLYRAVQAADNPSEALDIFCRTTFGVDHAELTFRIEMLVGAQRLLAGESDEDD